MKKYLALLWLALVCCVCISAHAETTSEGLVYTIRDTYIEITDYTGTAIRLTVPETINGIPVTHIAAEAFQGTTTLYSLTLPEGLLSIGDDAFWGCTNLTAINLPSTLQKLGEYAFADCDLSGTITIPESITVVPAGAFKGNEWLTTVNLSSKTTSISSSAFGNCPSLKNISFPVGLKSIGEKAFYGCESLTSLSFPSTLTSIQSEAFRNCTNLTGLSLPSQLVNIGEWAFSGCTSITTVKIPEGITTINQSAFSGCTSLITVTLPSSLTSIDSNAFASCTALKTMTLPETVTRIADNAFYNCKSLSHTTVLGSYADNWCIRNSSIYSDLFTYEQTDAGKVITGYNGTSSTVYIPSHFVGIGFEAFKGNTNISSLYVPGNVKTIGAWSFYQCDNLTHVRLENGVEKLDDEAFSSCDNLVSINIPDSVTELGSHTFYATYSLESISLPDSITTIPDNCFSQANKLKSVKLSENLTSIGKYAFNATALEKITIPETVTSIGDYAFITCLKLQEVSIPKNVTSIGAEAFRGCKELKKITILENVTSIGEDAFEGCPDELVIYGMTGSRAQSYADEYEITFVALDAPAITSGTCGTNLTWNLDGTGLLTISGTGEMTDYSLSILPPWGTEIKAVVIEPGVTGIGDLAFYRCSNLTSISMPDSVTSIGHSAFAGTGLTDVVIPKGVTNIAVHTFLECVYLENVTLPDNLTDIGDEVFFSCSNLKAVTIPASVTSIGEFAFWGCADELTIYGMTGSRAQFYAAENNITFVALDAENKLPVPQNPSWKAGSTATATWDAVDGADYYELTVYVYDEAGTTLLGTTTTGTSTNEVDVQLEANTIIKQQETEYTTVKLAYTVKAGVADDKGEFTYGAESEMAGQWEYTYALIQLQPPTNVVLNEDGTANWNVVEGAYQYWLCVHAFEKGTNKKYSYAFDSLYSGPLSSENGIITRDISSICKEAYRTAVEDGNIVIGDKVELSLEIKCVASSNSQYVDSEYCAESNRITYVFSDLIQLYPPENIVLHENGTISWNTIEEVFTYWVRVYAYEEGTDNRYAYVVDDIYSNPSTSENGISSCNITSICKEVYQKAVQEGDIRSGEKVELSLEIKCIARSNSQYVDSGWSAQSNRITYVFSDLIQLYPPENIVLHEDGTASWNAVEGTFSYWVYLYVVADGINSQAAYASTDLYPTASNGILTYDLSLLCYEAYKQAVEESVIKNGEAVKLRMNMICYAYQSQYVSSERSDFSNLILYTPFTPVDSISLSPSAPVLCVGNSYTLGKTITPEDGYYTTIDWSSTNPGVVSINSDGKITGVAAGDAQVTAAIGDVKATVPVKVYTISSNIGDKDGKDHVTDSAGDIIDDIINNPDPDLGDTDIPEEDMEEIKDQVTEGIWRGDKFFTDMKWYEEHFDKYKDNWGQIKQAAKKLNEELDVQFAGAYNITVEMYHKDKDGLDHKIGCIEEFENEVTFTFDLFSSTNEVQTGYARRYILVRIHRNEIETIDMEVEKGKGKAKSKGFSDFVVLYVDEPIDNVDLSAMKTLKLPPALTTIENEAFVGIAAEVVIIPASCTSIGSRAFADCPNLKYIVMPQGTDITLANDAFEGCNALILYK